MRTRSIRRTSLAWLLLAVGGFLGAHRFYLRSHVAGAAQLALLLLGLGDLPASRVCLGLLGLWWLADIHWVRVRLRDDGGARARAARSRTAKAHGPAAPDTAGKPRERFTAAAADGAVRPRPQQNPALQALQALLAHQEAQYMQAFGQGDLEQAEPVCAEAVATSRRLYAGPATAVILHLVNLAEIRRQMRSHDQAIATLHECLAMIDILGLDDGWRLGPTNTLALVHAASGRLAEAEALYKQTIAMALAAGKGASTGAVVRAFDNLAFLYADTGQARKAALCYARAVVHLDKLDAGCAPDAPSADSDLHAGLLNDYADLFMARRDAASARPLYARALALQERSCRGISSAAAHAHDALGLIAQEGGELRQALAHFRRALLLHQICTPDHLGHIAHAQRNVDGVSGTLAAVARAARAERSPT